MTSLEDFPEEVFRVLFSHFTNFEDIVRFEATHPKIRAKSEYAFWQRAQVLVLGSNSKTHQGPLILANVNQAIALPSDVTRILGVLEKTTNIREVVIGPESSLGGSYAKLLHALSRSTLSLRRIEVTYDCPEFLTSKGLETANFPSRSVHKKIISFVHSQAKNLNSLLLRMNTNEHILIERSVNGSAVNVECSSSCTTDARSVIHPFLSSFSYKSRNLPSSLTVNLKCPSESVLAVFDFCVSAAIPSQLRPHLARVNVRLSAPSGPEIVGYWDNLPQYSSLARVQWHFDDSQIDAARFSELCDNVADNKQMVVLSTPRFRRIIQRSVCIAPSPLRALSCAS
ncbi:hypothetical protein AAVH_04048 [Aphelenchoides avenae]|nr:hypothetical protein AAVH_04048 [Aphelenchus avenae]